MSDAAKCRKNGWKVGTQLRGREGGTSWHRLTTIELTAIGERNILAKVVAETGSGCEVCHPHEIGYEADWTLSQRNWRKVKR
jgi:hypothetical protein